jgi:hypothetical protein
LRPGAKFPPFLIARYGVELLEKLISGLQGAVLPYLKTDLALNYRKSGFC